MKGCPTLHSHPSREIWKHHRLCLSTHSGLQQRIGQQIQSILALYSGPTLSFIKILFWASITSLLYYLSNLNLLLTLSFWLLPSRVIILKYKSELISLLLKNKTSNCLSIFFNIQYQLLLPSSLNTFHYNHILNYLEFPTKATFSHIFVSLF